MSEKWCVYMEFKNYIGKTILGWLFYHYNDSFEESYGNKCYVYPRILVTGEKYQIINPMIFRKVEEFWCEFKGEKAQKRSIRDLDLWLAYALMQNHTQITIAITSTV